MKNITLISMLFIFCFTAKAQNKDSSSLVSIKDSILKTIQNYKDNLNDKSDSIQHYKMKHEADSLIGEANNNAQKNRELKQAISNKSITLKELETLIAQNKRQLDVIKNWQAEYKKDSLQKIQFLSKLDSDITKDTTKLNNLINETSKASTNLVSLKDTLTKTKDTLIKKQKELDEAIVNLSKKEDSLEVVAEVRLKDKATVYYRRQDALNSYKKADVETRVEMLEQFKKYDPTVAAKLKLTMGRQAVKNIISDKSLGYFAKNIDTTSIKEVKMNVYEGMIREITVKTSRGDFRNTLSPIDLVHFSEYKNKPLFCDTNNLQPCIKVGDAISYIHNHSYNDLPYSQFDATLYNDSSGANKRYLIKESTSINTYFDLAVFTDIKGLSGQSNGLAQITGSAKFITDTRTYFRRNALLLINYVSFVGGLSKFDNNSKATLIKSDNTVNRTDLLQRSYYYLGVKFNLLHWTLSPFPHRLIQDMQLNVGYNFVGSQIMMVAPKGISVPAILDTNYTTVTHNMIYLEPIVSFARYRNFNMTLSLPLNFINLKENSGISNRSTEYWAKPSIELMYYSKRDSNSKLFFRYNHCINLKSKDAFIQMQLGISASITDLLKGK